MPTSIQTRVEKLRERKRDRTSGEVRLRNEVLAKSNLRLRESSQDAIAYLEECIEEVPQSYTSKTFEECLRVEKQIRKALESDCNENSFDHQGSVTTNTHVKFHSDIDLLVACRKFVYCTPPYAPPRPYAGNPINDLITLRNGISETLTKSFPEAKVGTNGGKAISIEGGSLTRKIDIVPCAWEESLESLGGDKRYKGISIYDVKQQKRISNLPFLHNAQIDSKDLATNGALKGLIRMIKSVRYDSDANIPVSSYDIAALCYNVPADTSPLHFRRLMQKDFPQFSVPFVSLSA